MSEAAPPFLTPDALARFLIAPDAGERLSAAPTTSGETGPGALVLDLSASSEDVDREKGEALVAALAILPCVTIALDPQGSARRAHDPRARLADACDVRVEDEAGVEAVLAGPRAAPIAALAYVQLLRGAPRRSVYEALVAESFVYSTLQSGAEHRRWLESRPRRRKRRGDPSTRAVRMERDRGRLEIHLCRPEKHNAFSREMRDGLCEALALALADPSIEVVAWRGEGDSFCSGGDLDEFGSLPDPAAGHAIRTTRSPALLLSRLADRVEVELHGACIGAGIELPGFTERLVAREDAFFQLPEVRLGLVPGAGGTASLPPRIGRQRTAWLGLTGARIDARTALAWGLVDEVRLGQSPSSEGEAAHPASSRAD